MQKEILLGLLRHALTTAGGLLVSKGYLGASGLEELVGALITVAGALWSIIHKVKAPDGPVTIRSNTNTSDSGSTLVTRVGVIVPFLLCLALLTGCATGRPLGPNIAPAVKVAALVGTTEALRAHPEWCDGFQTAANDLKLIEQSPVIDFALVLAIVQRLPINELKSERATLYISAGTILLAETYNRSLSLDQVQQLKPVVAALRQGIELGLQ